MCKSVHTVTRGRCRLGAPVATVVVALAVTAAPASARVGGKMHLDDISMGIVTDKAVPKLLETAKK